MFEPRNYVVNKGVNEKTPLEKDVFSIWLAWQSDFRTYNWAKAVGDPELTVREVAHLISLI